MVVSIISVRHDLCTNTGQFFSLGGAVALLCRKFFSTNSIQANFLIAFPAIVWFSGLFLGAYCAFVSSNNISLLMPALFFQRLSISGMIMSLFFPLALLYVFYAIKSYDKR